MTFERDSPWYTLVARGGYDRVSPVFLIIACALVVLVLGLVVSGAEVLALGAGAILVIGAASIVLWLRGNLY